MSNNYKILNTIKLNYFTIRTMYDIVNGYVTSRYDASDDMYVILGTSKSSYDKLVNTGTGLKTLEEKAKDWYEITGIEREILLGKKLFDFESKEISNAIKNIEMGTVDIEIDELKKIKDIIKATLRKMPLKQMDKNLLACYNLAKYKGQYPTRVISLQNIKSIYHLLDKVTVEHLQLLTLEELEQYSNKFDEVTQLTKALILIKKHKK